MKREQEDAAAAQERLVKARSQRSELLQQLRDLDATLAFENYLEQHGLSDPAASNSDGHNVLHLLAEDVRLGHVSEGLALRVAEEAPASALTELTRAGRSAGATALHMLCGAGRDSEALRCRLIEVLVRRGCDLEARDARGSTCFLRAAGVQSVGVLRLLTELRADVHATHRATGRNAYDIGQSDVRRFLDGIGVRGTGTRGQSSRQAFPERSRQTRAKRGDTHASQARRDRAERYRQWY